MELLAEPKTEKMVMSLAKKAALLLSVGKTQTTVRRILKVTKDQWAMWMTTNPYFKSTIEAAEAEVVGVVEEATYRAAMDGDSKAGKFFLESRSREEWGAERPYADDEFGHEDPKVAAKAINKALAAGLIKPEDAMKRIALIKGYLEIVDPDEAAKINIVFPHEALAKI